MSISSATLRHDHDVAARRGVKISVITVGWNAAATIGDTLRSVAAQTYADIEHVIVDGASTDATAALVTVHARPGHVFVSAPDKGIYDAMNKGLALATGDLIGFLNADDFFCRTDAVALIAAAAANPAADAVSGGVVIVREHDVHRATRAYPPTPFAPWMLRFAHMPPHPAFYARRATYDRLGGYDPALKIGADFEWMVRFFHDARLRAATVPQTLVSVRDGGVSNQGLASRRKISTEALASLRRHGIASAAPLVWAKYLAKAAQFVAAPVEWPAPAGVRWEPLA
jgi:glycosyltransferase involved in cell wall biosynthesis